MKNAFICFVCYIVTRVTSPPYKMSLDDFIQDSDSEYNLTREDLTDEIPETRNYKSYEPGSPPWVKGTVGEVTENDLEGSKQTEKIVVRDADTGEIIVEADKFAPMADVE
jgi:hypothetical protein